MSRIFLFFFVLISSIGFSQGDTVFHVVDIRVEGNHRTNEDAIIIHSQLKIDSWIRVPGTQTVRAMKSLWETGIYKFVEIIRKDVPAGIELILKVEEYFSLGDINYLGLSKSEQQKLEKNQIIKKRKVYNPQTIKIIEFEINKLLVNKGYVKNRISLDSVRTNKGIVSIVFSIEKGKRYRVDNVIYKNDFEIPEREFRKSSNNIRPKNLIIPGSLYENNAIEEINTLEGVAKNKGYAYAEIDSLQHNFKDKKVDLSYHFNDAVKYVFGDFIWKGNEVLQDSILNKLTNKLRGNIYNKELLDELLYFSNNNKDVSSIYYEKGYAGMHLFHQLLPNDSTQVMDVNIHVLEGKIMNFGNITFSGNVRTKDNVMLREVLTIPGDIFSRSAIILSQQKLSQLEYFQNSKMDVKMHTDTTNGTVDLEYIVKEKISDKLYLSGGYGTKLVGTIGFDFKNFSGKDLLKKGTRWNPLPAGGGQHLSLKGQTDGMGYYGTSFNFYEPWLAGKPIGFSFNSSYASIKDSIGHLRIFNLQTTLSHKPFKNDAFTYLNYALGYRNYNADNFNVFGETTGKFKALTFKIGLLKNTTPGGAFPIDGNRIETSILTSLPPFSRYSETEALSLTTKEKFNWFEYYKFKFSFKNYQGLDSKKSIVLATKFGVGYLGYFNKNIGTVPFERFIMGGTGLTNFDISANEFIGLRGYEPGDISSSFGDALAMKLSFELRKRLIESERYMLSTHLFAETGNTYTSLYNMNVYNLKTAVGFGARIFAPIIGVLGIDIGWGLNKTDFLWKSPSVQFTIGMDIGDF